MANKTFGSSSDTIGDQIGDVTSRMQERASELGQKASEFGHNAVGAIDARRVTAASGLESAAEGLHANADILPPSASRFAHQTSDKLEATASYVRKNRSGDMLSDLEGLVSEYPAQALLGAVAVGFLAGRLLRRN